MTPPAKPDEILEKYATTAQWVWYLRWVEYGSYTAAAKAAGADRTTLRRGIKAIYRKAAQQGYAPAHDLVHEVPDGMTSKGTSIRYGEDGAVEQYWNKTTRQGMEPEDRVQIEGAVPTKISTLYDNAGKVQQQWIQEKPEDKARLDAWTLVAKELSGSISSVPEIKRPIGTFEDLLVGYPIGDHHLGMLSWDKETGADWDIKIGEKVLGESINYLVKTAPPASTAIIVFLGDFLHYDSFQAVTPTSRNLLDTDTRYPKMVRTAIRSMRRAIETAAAVHDQVRVIVEIGNHDLSSSIFLMETIHALYENNERVTIDTSPKHFHYYEHGRCLIGTHHGHGAKLEKLPEIMAADVPEVWGRTKHRFWWTGHIHSAKSLDFPGCSVERFRVLAPEDAWAHQKGYRSARDMKAIVLDKEHGEVSRLTVNPEMFT